MKAQLWRGEKTGNSRLTQIVHLFIFIHYIPVVSRIMVRN